MKNDGNEVMEARVEEMLRQIEQELLDLCRILPVDEREALLARIRQILEEAKGGSANV